MRNLNLNYDFLASNEDDGDTPLATTREFWATVAKFIESADTDWPSALAALNAHMANAEHLPDFFDELHGGNEGGYDDRRIRAELHTMKRHAMVILRETPQSDHMDVDTHTPGEQPPPTPPSPLSALSSIEEPLQNIAPKRSRRRDRGPSDASASGGIQRKRSKTAQSDDDASGVDDDAETVPPKKPGPIAYHDGPRTRSRGKGSKA